MYKYTTCFWTLNFVFRCVYFYWLCEINKGVFIIIIIIIIIIVIIIIIIMQY